MRIVTSAMFESLAIMLVVDVGVLSVAYLFSGRLLLKRLIMIRASSLPLHNIDRIKA